MTKYANVKVNISQGQINKIKRTLQAGSQVSIQLAHEDLYGEHVLALKKSQINKITKAYQSGTGTVIKMSATQLQHNQKLKAALSLLYCPH